MGKQIETRTAPLIKEPVVQTFRDPDIRTQYRSWVQGKIEGVRSGAISLADAAERIALVLYAKEMKKRKLSHETQVDPLTGLGNFKAADILYQALIARGEPFGVILADLDDFKSLNTNLGHEATNDLLVQFGIVLTETLYKPSDERAGDIVTRFGTPVVKDTATRKHGDCGDEFLVFLPSCHDAKTLRVVCQKLKNAVSGSPFFVDTDEGMQSSHVTMSMGAAIFNPATDDAIRFLNELSVNGTKKAKEDGKNRFHIIHGRTRRPENTVAQS